jgi:hypothetical protein
MNSVWPIPDESTSSWSTTLPFEMSCRGIFFLDDDSHFQVVDCPFTCESYGKHRVSSPVMMRLTNVPPLSVLSIKSPTASALCYRNVGPASRCVTLYWVTREMFRSSHRILWLVLWLVAAAATSPVWSRWQAPTLQILGSWVQFWPLLADLHAHHPPNCLPLCKTFVSLKHSTTPYARFVIWNVSLTKLTNSWQKLTFSRCSNCYILDFRRSQTNALCFSIHRTASIYLCT